MLSDAAQSCGPDVGLGRLWGWAIRVHCDNLHRCLDNDFARTHVDCGGDHPVLADHNHDNHDNPNNDLGANDHNSGSVAPRQHLEPVVTGWDWVGQWCDPGDERGGRRWTGLGGSRICGHC